MEALHQNSLLVIFGALNHQLFSKRGIIQLNAPNSTHGIGIMASQMGRFCRQYRRIILENASKNKFLIDRPYQVEGRRLFWISSCVQTEQSHEIEQVNRPVRAVDEVSRIQPKQFEVNFQEFIRLKNYIRTRQRVAGMPFAFLGLGTSSVVSAYMFPEMFDATPENVQLIM